MLRQKGFLLSIVFNEILLQRPNTFSHLLNSSLYILYPVGYDYIMLVNISLANLHATSAYECELLIFTWPYLPRIRLDNAESLIRRCRRCGNGAYSV